MISMTWLIQCLNKNSTLHIYSFIDVVIIKSKNSNILYVTCLLLWMQIILTCYKWSISTRWQECVFFLWYQLTPEYLQKAGSPHLSHPVSQWCTWESSAGSTWLRSWTWILHIGSFLYDVLLVHCKDHQFWVSFQLI